MRKATKEEIVEAKRILRRFQYVWFSSDTKMKNGNFEIKRRRLYVYNRSLGTSYSVFIKDIAKKLIKEWEKWVNTDILERHYEFERKITSLAEKQHDRDEDNKLDRKIERCIAAMKEAKWRRKKEKYEKLQQKYNELLDLIDVGQVGVLAEDAWHEKHDKYYF